MNIKFLRYAALAWWFYHDKSLVSASYRGTVGRSWFKVSLVDI